MRRLWPATAALVEEAIVMRPIGDAHSTAAVLHWRLGVLASTPAPRARGPLASLPPTEGPALDVARQAGELIGQRWRDLRGWLAATTDPLPWAPALGQRPPDPEEESAWLTAATAVTAYRERYDIPAHTPMLGARAAASRPDARAAWDHACLQADRYLARRLRHLNEDELADLDARQQAIIDNPPPFDPSELERARQDLGPSSGSRGGRLVATRDRRARPAPEELLAQRLERAAQAHRHWRRAATDAQAVRRQIALEQGRRRRKPTLVHATRR